MIKCRPIAAAETIPIRQLVLRPGKDIATCLFDGDHLSSTKHFGIFDDEQLAGVLSLYHNNNANFDYKLQIQIRGMAILENHQKKNLGKILFEFAEATEANRTELIWFNARLSAVGFYEKLGYSCYSDIFEIPDVGPHYVMFKITK